MPKKPNEIGQRLRQWGTSRYPSLAAFARALGWIPQNLTPYLKGTTLPGTTVQARLRELGCDIEWLMTGKEPGVGKKRQIEFLEGELVPIPVFEYARAGSKTMMLAEKPSYYIPSTKSKDDTRFALVVKGTSMQPLIMDGELVVVSKKKEVKDGDVCLVMFEDGDACLRRVYCRDRTVTLTSENEAEYPPTFHKKSEIRSIYRMVQKITNY